MNIGKGQPDGDMMIAALYSQNNSYPALEFVTQGLARATSHRVLSPLPGATPRYSVPFFQNISLNARLADHILSCSSNCLVANVTPSNVAH